MVHRLRAQQNQRLWGVHRLDKVTSGILVLAKDVTTARALTRRFAAGNVVKYYVGLSAKRPTKKKQGWVVGNMVPSRNKSWKLLPTGKAARTRFFTARVVGSSSSSSSSSCRYTCLLFRPYTGKTHQLRVAAKAMGMPLLGDPIYKDGTASQATTTTATASSTRTYLHASGIVLPALYDVNDDQRLLEPPVAIWSPPPFDGLLDQENGGVVHKLLRNYCNVPELLQAAGVVPDENVNMNE